MTEPAVVAPEPAAPTEQVTTPTVPVVTPTPTPPPVDWRASLPSDLQQHPTLADTASVESLARQHIEQAALIGRKGIIPPADDSPEEAERYYNELGRPVKPDLYTFGSLDPTARTPETNEFLDGLRPVFHGVGVTDKQADAVTKGWMDIVAKDQADKAQAHDERAKLTVADLQTKWGLAYEPRHEMAKRAGNQIFGEAGMADFAAAIVPDGSRVGDSAGFIENLYENHGKYMDEDSLVSGSPGSAVMDPAGAQAEIDKLLADKEFAGVDGPYYDTNHKEHGAAQAKMKALYAQVHPEQGA